MLTGPVRLEPKLLFETLVERYRTPEGKAPLVSVQGQPELGAFVTFAGVEIAMMRQDGAMTVNWQECASPATTRWHWPEAANVCARHQAQMIFGFKAKQTHPPNAAKALTAVAGAVAALCPETVLAGLWDVNVVNSAAVWISDSARIFKPFPDYPFHLWVSHHPYQDAKREGGMVVVSRGLARFVGREVEVSGPAANYKMLVDRAYGLTSYLLHHGAKVKNGDTVGISATERLRVTLQISERFKNLAVVAASF